MRMAAESGPDGGPCAHVRYLLLPAYVSGGEGSTVASVIKTQFHSRLADVMALSPPNCEAEDFLL